MTAGGSGGAERPGLRHSGFFAFRVAALPMAVLTTWAEGVEAPAAAPDDLAGAVGRDRDLLRRRLRAIGSRPEVRGALAVASPDLLTALRTRGDDTAVESGLVRYISRMSSRATPYGLFAACGVGSIGRRTRIEVPPPARWQRHTRLDADFLDALIRHRAAELRPRLELRPNDSLYALAGRWHFVQSRLDRLERTYHLVEVADSRYLRRVLEVTGHGATAADVHDALVAAGADRQRAVRYAGQLVDAQVIVPTLAVAITGRLPLDVLIDDLDALNDTGTVAVLRDVREELTAIDAEGPAASPERHEHVATQLRRLGPAVEPARLLQVDMTLPDCAATLATSTVDEVIRGVDLLRRIAAAEPPPDLDAFRDAFRERYGLQEVPLLEALDEDIGVGYGGESQRRDRAPLLDGLQIPAEVQQQAPLGRREHRLLDLIQRSWDGAREVELSRDDIDALRRDESPPLPPAMDAVAVLARTRDGPRLLLTRGSGPSGARLLGRFCHWDTELHRHVRAHLRDEEELDPEAVHAEIVHLPSGRLVNVLARPVLREYEIEWLGRSGAPPERRLRASDLLVSLRDDRFVLLSRTLGRRVVPHLTSAHNYGRRSPGVYRFLAALQADGCAERIEWSWSPFSRVPFTPRVRWGNIVFARARWRADAAELRTLDQRDPVSRWTAVQGWRARRRMPRWICLVEGDNILVFDLDNALSVDTLVRAVRRRDEALFEELFPTPDELVADGPDGRRALELVVPLVRVAPAHAGDPATPPPDRARSLQTVRRSFPPGSGWTYVKLYTGSATADRLLRDDIAPLVRQLIGSGAADGWFFLRYRDPRFHLRVRFHGDPDRIRPSVDRLLSRVLDDDLAYDAVIGTYRREVERYGGPQGITVAEQIFHADSDAVADLLGMFVGGDVGMDARWRIGVLGADLMLRDLGLDESQRSSQARRVRDRFEGEFRADAALRKAVSAKVRAEHSALEELFAAGQGVSHALAPGIRVLGERSRRVAPLAARLAQLDTDGRLTLPVEAVATSLVHMWLNRLCRSENRFHEYVTYALLTRLHEARAGRGRSQR